MFRHVAPAVLGMNLSYAAVQAVSTTGLVASLAFLGVGVPEPTPELGQMMQEGIALLPVARWIAIVPGVTVLILGIGFGLIADSLGSRTSDDAAAARRR
jgi:peptide/nickel transport system permease protein